MEGDLSKAVQHTPQRLATGQEDRAGERRILLEQDLGLDLDYGFGHAGAEASLSGKRKIRSGPAA